ncbi:MAG: hypothetical protein QOJ64_1514 [Acidobacteriota bacterium]|jgi:hypothetical protein|nr:hypothetical protein [Acidobacteriota bacterium]
MIICSLRYVVDSDKGPEFEHYARVWMRLIEKYGGTHLGYFMPAEAPPSTAFSFPGIGEEGPNDIAVAIFTFPNLDAYEKYRRGVAQDPECHAITSHYERTKCFTRYERTFMRSVPR